MAVGLVGCSGNPPQPAEADGRADAQASAQLTAPSRPVDRAFKPAPAQAAAPTTDTQSGQQAEVSATQATPAAPEAATPSDGGEVFAKGRASWYGPGFHGRRTASGEPFDMHALTAAHKTLPFGTRVRVRSVHTGKEVVVRINDRGPFTHRRILDLSLAAATTLGVRHRGVTEVHILRE